MKLIPDLSFLSPDLSFLSKEDVPALLDEEGGSFLSADKRVSMAAQHLSVQGRLILTFSAFLGLCVGLAVDVYLGSDIMIFWLLCSSGAFVLAFLPWKIWYSLRVGQVRAELRRCARTLG